MNFIPCYFLVFLIAAVVNPYLSIMVRGLGYNPFWIGLLLGIFEAAGIAGSLLSGWWADKTGKFKLTLIISTILPVLAAIPLVKWVRPLTSAIFLFIMAFGLRSVIPLTDAYTTIKIGKSGNYGMIRVWGSISFILMSLFLQWTPFLKLNNPTNISIWIMIFSTLVIFSFIKLPETYQKFPSDKKDNISEKEFEKEYEIKNNEKNKIDEDKTIYQSGNSINKSWHFKKISLITIYTIGGFTIIFLSRFAMTAIYTFFPLYLTEIVKWNVVGVLFAISSVSEVPFMFISVKLIRRFGALPLLAFSAAGITLRLLILAFLPFKSFIVISQMFHSVCFGIYHPAAVHFISAVFPAESRGKGMSLFLLLGSGLPMFLGTLAGGAVVFASGYKSLFIIYAAVTMAAVLIYWLIKPVSRKVEN